MLSMYIASLMRREDGATMVEYGLMVALIAVVALVAVTAMGVGVNNMFCQIGAKLGSGAVC